MDMNSETQAMTRRVTWGQILVPCAQGGRLFLGGSVLVALKMEKAVASMESTIRLQAKLTPRKNIFAIRTLIFTFCSLLAATHSRGREEYVPSPVPAPFLFLLPSSLRSALPGRWG